MASTPVENVTLTNETTGDPMMIAIAEFEARATLHGDQGFVVLSAALVFFMTPGLGYFYSGMARSKNALSLIFLCFLSMAVVLVQWTLFGFSLTFSEWGGPFIGDFNYGGGTLLDMHHTGATPVSSVAFFIYQGMFATITPALMFGSSAERVRILPALLFIFIWTTVVYDPIAYWTWSKNGWLATLGSLDYAGGTPVHIASGFAGLAQALVLGKREGFADCKDWKPHNLSNVFLGTAILWFGWFGFNGGSALAGTSRAAMAASVTSIAASAGGLTWVLFDYRHERKLSALGFCSGAVAALVSITPASGFVAPWAAIVIGFLAGLVCNLCCHLKHVLGYDDALDVFGTHGMGGVLGNILTGIFAQQWIARLDNSNIDGGWVDGNWIQVPKQLAGSAAGAAWSFCWTCVILIIMQKTPGLALRLNKDNEEMGVDLAEMGEVAYTVTDVVKSVKRRLSLGGSARKSPTDKWTDFNLHPIKEKSDGVAQDHEQPKHGTLAPRVNTNGIHPADPVEEKYGLHHARDMHDMHNALPAQDKPSQFLPSCNIPESRNYPNQLSPEHVANTNNGVLSLNIV
jgi:Amt family ammonium transporter